VSEPVFMVETGYGFPPGGLITSHPVRMVVRVAGGEYVPVPDWYTRAFFLGAIAPAAIL
jgi:hypothetical protein